MYDDVYNTKYGFKISPEHIPSEDDMKKYAQGDSSMIPILTEGLIQFITNELEWFLKQNERARPHREDCMSEALLALTMFVSDNCGKLFSPPQFISYAKQVCLGQVADWLREMSIAVTVPKTTQHRNSESLTQQAMLDVVFTGGDAFEQVWFDEFMETISEFDREIIRLKIEGHSNRSVAEQMGVHWSTIQDHLDKLNEFYKEGDYEALR